VLSSTEDPITTTETNISNLVRNEKRVCLRNLHVVDSPGPQPQQTITAINFHNPNENPELIDILINPIDYNGCVAGLLLEEFEVTNEQRFLDGVERYRLSPSEDFGQMYARSDEKADLDWSRLIEGIRDTELFLFDAVKPSALRGIKLAPGQKLRGLLTLKGSTKVAPGKSKRFQVLQLQNGEIVGGSTYDLRLNTVAGLHPVSHIRVILEKVRILDDLEPWFKGRGDFQFNTQVEFNDNPCRRMVRRFPERGVYKISDAPGYNEQTIDQCIFDGYVSGSDTMTVTVQPVEKDTFDCDDIPARYMRNFEGSPETWVGKYTPDDEADDPEKKEQWMVWYSIESVRL
jgi:hypothetical protein